MTRYERANRVIAVQRRMKDQTNYIREALKIYQTVDELIVTLRALSFEGKGGYLVSCNDEYWLAHKGDEGKVIADSHTVDFGGYTP